MLVENIKSPAGVYILFETVGVKNEFGSKTKQRGAMTNHKLHFLTCVLLCCSHACVFVMWFCFWRNRGLFLFMYYTSGPSSSFSIFYDVIYQSFMCVSFFFKAYGLTIRYILMWWSASCSFFLKYCIYIKRFK